MHPLTLEEAERRAYANGDVATATLLARAMDGDAERAEEARAEGFSAALDAVQRAIAALER